MSDQDMIDLVLLENMNEMQLCHFYILGVALFFGAVFLVVGIDLFMRDE